MTAVATPTDVWTRGASGAWSVAANWSLRHTPTPGHNVDIEASSPFTVTMDVGNFGFQGLTLIGATLDLEGGYLAAYGASTLQNARVVGVQSLMLFGGGAVSGLTVGGGVKLYNAKQVTQSGGTVTLGDSSASKAQIYNLSGATWTIADVSGISWAGQSGWGFDNIGMFQKTSGSGTAVISANFVSTGTISSASGGDIEFDGKAVLSGTYVGPGMVDYGPNGAALIGNVQVTGSSCQTNWGKVYQTGDMTLYDGSTIMNAAGALWSFDGDASLLLAAGQAAGPDINGAGTIAKIAGTGVSRVGVNVTALGAVKVATGTLAFSGATNIFNGAVSGAGTFESAGGFTEIAPNATLSVAHWTLAGGETVLTRNLTYAGVFAGQAGATLAGSLTLKGAANLSGLSLIDVDHLGSGNLDIEAKASVSGLTIGGHSQLFVGGAVTQSGGNVTLGDAVQTDTASFTIARGGVWDIVDASSILSGAYPGFGITIGSGAGSGLLEKTGSGVSVVAPPVLNNETNLTTSSGTTYNGVEVSSGTLDFMGVVGGTGSDNIVGPGTLEFESYVSAGQTVNFFGSGGSLAITWLKEFSGAISGFDTTGSNDALLLGGYLAFAGATETSTAATLSFSNGASLTLTGDYVGKTFSAQSLAGGVLKIT